MQWSWLYSGRRWCGDGKVCGYREKGKEGGWKTVDVERGKEEGWKNVDV